MKKSLLFLAATLMMTTSANAECLSLRQARKEYPKEYLSWRGHHCWFAPNAKHKRHKNKEHVKAEEEIPLPTASPRASATPEPAVVEQPQLTRDSLLRHGLTQPRIEPELTPSTLRKHGLAQSHVRPVEVAEQQEAAPAVHEVVNKPKPKTSPTVVYLLVLPLIIAVLIVWGVDIAALRKNPLRWLS